MVSPVIWVNFLAMGRIVWQQEPLWHISLYFIAGMEPRSLKRQFSSSLIREIIY
ncbi:MAG: hypothetical protein V7K48_01825 [Nostoc sp.]|uniref:hypothetical protein n=1 Tax=Nostoc sp. TaxID=1180 RepID=UPI002FFCED9D